MDLTVRFDPSLTLREAHDLCDRLEARPRERFPEIGDVVVHAGPEPPMSQASPRHLTPTRGRE